MEHWHGVVVGGAVALLVLAACGGTVTLKGQGGGGGSGEGVGDAEALAGKGGKRNDPSVGSGGFGGIGGTSDGSGGLIGIAGHTVQAPGPNEPKMPLCEGRPDCPWSVRERMPTHSRGQAAAAQGGAIYVFGGESLELDLVPAAPSEFPSERAGNSAVYRYEVASDTWEEKAPLPQGAYGLTAHALIDKVYVFAGYPPGGPEAKVQTYNPATDEWSEGPPMPTSRYDFSSAALDGKVYVTGGIAHTAEQPDAQSPTTLLEIFDPTSGWSTGKSLPKAVAGAASCALDGGVYVFGGYQNNRTSIYDVATDTWSQGTASKVARNGQSCVTVGEKLILIGGRTLAGETLDVVEVYDPSGDTWQTLEPMPTARTWFGADAIDRKIYVFGGRYEEIQAGYGLLNNVEVLDLTP